MFFPRVPAIALLLCSLLTAVEPVHADLRWHWEDAFEDSERSKLTNWLTQTFDAVERWAGPYPFDVHLYLHRRDTAREPVPWANTWREGAQAIHFYVDPRYNLSEFLADWTAPHEFAHLLLPYLGRNNAWAAEGFASYLQHDLMVELGVIDAAEAQRRRDVKMNRAVAQLEDESRSLPESMPKLREEGKYPTFYWGGAVYWERVDMTLRDVDSSLQQVVRGFLRCCRLERRSLSGLADTLDEQLAVPSTVAEGGGVFRSELATMRTTAGCPDRYRRARPPEPRVDTVDPRGTP